MSIEKAPVIVVGAGPAGLAASFELQRAGSTTSCLSADAWDRAGAIVGTASA